MSDWDDDEFDESEAHLSRQDRSFLLRRKARRNVARIARFLRLRRLAEAIEPKLTPWWLQRPIPYIEHFAGEGESTQAVVDPAEFEDVLLVQARWRADAKRKKLIEVAFTEPDPVKAGQAAAELHHMILQGHRA